MSFSFFKHFRTRTTPQTEPIPGRERDMAQNSAGGYTFVVDDWVRLERFLILGSEGGSYYATERALTLENAAVVLRCLEADAARTISTIVGISDSGRAPKNDPAVLALAIAAGHGHTAAAMEALPKVCRTGTHLFAFTEAVQGMRGWGRALRKGVSNWYEQLEPSALAYQVAKYQSRNGWSHRDLLRLVHPVAQDEARQAVYRWVVGGADALGQREVSRNSKLSVYGDVREHLPKLLSAVDEARTADRKRVVELVREHGLPRECVPTEHLNHVDVWEALLEKMPLTAMIRNLGKMTSVGLLTPLSEAARTVCERLANTEYLRKSRIHPLGVLLAASTYKAGQGVKGSLTWSPVSQVLDALDQAFDRSFAHVEPTGKRTLIGLDVSGSMAGYYVAGTHLSARECSAAMCLVTARLEARYQIMAFSTKFMPLDITARDRISDVVSKTHDLPFSGTDCSLPMRHALEHKIETDLFVVYTDSETWAGPVQPVQALQEYRRRMGIPARLVVVGMTANKFTIADPTDAGMLDVVGFDANAPQIMADFARA